MDYKEKYEMALETVQEILGSGSDSIKMSSLKLRLQSVFPELKEPSDEKIRKVLIDYFNLYKRQEECGIKTFYGIPTDNILAWLEKQGEKKLQGKSILDIWKNMRLEVYQQASGNRHEPNYSDDNTKMFSLNDIDEIIEKMNEQKPVESIEEFKDDDGLYNAINILEKTLLEVVTAQR